MSRIIAEFTIEHPNLGSRTFLQSDTEQTEFSDRCEVFRYLRDRYLSEGCRIESGRQVWNTPNRNGVPMWSILPITITSDDTTPDQPTPTRVELRVPSTFFYDHLSRDLVTTSGDDADVIVKNTKRHLVVRLSLEDVLELLDDAAYYAEEMGGQLGFEQQGLIASARGTVTQIKKQQPDLYAAWHETKHDKDKLMAWLLGGGSWEGLV